VSLIERHRIVCLRATSRPGRNDFSGLSINNGDLSRPWKIHKDSRSVRLKLKRLWMSVEFNVGKLSSILIDNSESAAAIADPQPILLRIVADIIRVVPVSDGLQQLEGCAIENAQRSVRSICDVNPVRVRRVRDPLRLMKTGDRVHLLRILDVDHLKRI